jgi:serine/threonine protein kinase
MKICESCGACFDDGYDLCGFDGGALEAWFPGNRVVGGRYLLEQRVAAGAMGVVVRATHLQVGSTVAVKLMKPEKDDAHVALARFQREAQILGQIKHPNAVLVIDFGVEIRSAGEEQVSQPYLVMEFLRGEPLSAMLARKGTLSLVELERILVPLCDAVEEAHAVGVIHRDIKPSNVVLEKLRDGSEIVKVLDFGIAKFVARGPTPPAKPAQPRDPELTDDEAPFGPAPVTFSGDGDLVDDLADLLDDDDDDFLDEVVAVREQHAATLATARERPPRTPSQAEGAPVPPRERTTDAGFMIGTVPYMAPEQMTGERVSVRTDVHAVAVLAFQCLAGRLPYDGDDEDIIAAKLGDDRPSLADVGVEVPADVDAVLRRSFARDPDDRPASVREISDAIRSAHVRHDDGDAATTALVKIGAIEKSLALVEAAARAWVEVETEAGGEEHYAKARDLLLAVDAPLRRVHAALSAATAPLPADAKSRFAEARSSFAARVTSVRRMIARIEAKPAAADAEFGEYLGALWMRLDVVAQGILDGLGALTEDEAAHEAASLLPAQLFAPVAAETRPATLGELADRLLAKDPLESVDALEELLETGVDQVVQTLASSKEAEAACGAALDTGVAARMARGLWRHADTLLLHELAPGTRRAFRLLPFLAGLRGFAPAAPFVTLARALGNASLGAAGVDDALASCARPEDRVVLLRCLLVHSSAAVRKRAIEGIELSDLWNVIAHPSTPIAVLDFVFAQVSERAPNEYLKIFFFCVRDTLRAASSTSDVRDALRLLARYFTVRCFHEDIVFEPLLELDRTLRQRAADDSAVDSAYADALATFTAAGSHETRPLEHMREVPLPILRKLAREGRFLNYFVSHSNDRVARETLPHLFRLEDVTQFLRIPTIHRVVLTEVAKRKRFFRKEPPKLALLQNPKTPAIVARMFLPLVSEEQLRILSANKHINPDVRRLITSTLSRART